MKTLIIDCNVLLMSSVFVQRRNKGTPISYFVLLQIFKHIKTQLPDKVYLVADKGKSWRAEIYPDYKSGRADFRASFPDINWEQVYEDYNTLLYNIQKYTPIDIIQMKHIEGDDIISYLCRYIEDEKVVITNDGDIAQLAVLPKVKILLKRRGGKVIEVEDGSNVVETKVREGDKSDKIKPAKSLVEEIRNQILVDLLAIPTTIDAAIHSYISHSTKTINKELFLQEYNYKFLPKTYDYLINNKRESE